MCVNQLWLYVTSHDILGHQFSGQSMIVDLDEICRLGRCAQSGGGSAKKCPTCGIGVIHRGNQVQRATMEVS